MRIEDYALIGDCQSAALVGRDGSIDWLCLPRFDSDACFAKLLGTDENGFWRIAPTAPVLAVRRSYRRGTMTLETEMDTSEGTIVIVDFMAIGDATPDLVRIVTCKRGRVPMRMELVLRPGFGQAVPWVQKADGGIVAIAGPDGFRLAASVPVHGENLRTVSDFSVSEGESASFVLAWGPSHRPAPRPVEPYAALEANDRTWRAWSARCLGEGPYVDVIERSLLTLKALTFADTGGIVAAPTTSLPEHIGGVRNWDYRFCWLRDSTLTLSALLNAGFVEEAKAWRDWLLRAAAGAPSQLQVLYGLAGERRLVEVELAWLTGYEGSRPVRIGNLASEQRQLDVYGELVGALYLASIKGLANEDEAWAFQRALVRHVETVWHEPDSGIWEVRGPVRHFVHSKVMCWLAFDCAVKSVERFGLEGDLERWRAARDRIHAEVCEKGYSEEHGSFVQHYGAEGTDASLLMIPIIGFLPPDDPRVVGTVARIERELMRGGLVDRYLTHEDIDGLPAGEGTFLACSFWLADALVLMGRIDDATVLFERLVGLCNDVGLLAEEYDPRAERMLGNFPQALSHLALVNTALALTRAKATGPREP